MKHPNGSKRATITDVAHRAGVGKGTVSYVLNGHARTARISEETTTRVFQAAEELGYRPNALARMLLKRKSDILAVVFQRGYFFTSWSSFTAEVMRGVSSAAVELGFDLLLHTRDVGRDCEADVLSDGRVDGVLILRDQGDPIVPQLVQRGFPCVRFFSKSESEDEPFVDADNVDGGAKATRHLLELGHRHIALLKGPDGSMASNDRLAGYQGALREAGVQYDPSLVKTVPTAASLSTEIEELMARETKPTAFFVWSDDVAIACLSALHDMGLRVPADVSVVGFDSLEVCSRSVPPLTSVRQPVYEMAKHATALLAELIAGEEPTRKQILYPLEIDVRGSTAPCPK